MKYIGLFHFVTIQGNGLPGLPKKNRIPWGKSVNSNFPGL